MGGGACEILVRLGKRRSVPWNICFDSSLSGLAIATDLSVLNYIHSNQPANWMCPNSAPAANTRMAYEFITLHFPEVSIYPVIVEPTVITMRSFGGVFCTSSNQ